MKKILVVIIGLTLYAFSCEASNDLTGRFGVGVNWEGLQAKYGFAEDWLAEGKIQFADNNTTVGARTYYMFAEFPRMLLVVLPYVGAEFDWVFSEYLNGGVLTGVFCGFELMPSRNIGIELDIGLYYENLWSNLGTMLDFGLIVNLGATIYF